MHNCEIQIAKLFINRDIEMLGGQCINVLCVPEFLKYADKIVQIGL